MKITEKEVRYVADLANLKLTGEEIGRLSKDLDEILTHIDTLNELDTSNVQPMAQVLYDAEENSTLREDRSVADLLDTDYTFLNERLAIHYGIPGVTGIPMRRVPLPDRAARAQRNRARRHRFRTRAERGLDPNGGRRGRAARTDHHAGSPTSIARDLSLPL